MAALLLAAAAAPGQPRLAAPPGFSRAAIATAADEVVAGWENWLRADRGNDQRLFRLPMSEARIGLERGLGGFEEFLEKRRAYAAAVAALLEENRIAPQPGAPPVTVARVYEEQIQVLGLSLAGLRQKLDALRETRDWLAIRRAVQDEIGLAMELQASRRAAIPIELSLTQRSVPAAISAVEYRTSERELEQRLDRLWTRYYQAIADAVEQKPGGSAPLRAARGTSAQAAASAAPANPLAGVWEYVEGSQKFNGVAEPRAVMLELWVDGGMLHGRYRAELPDFSGVRAVDVRLRGPLAGPGPRVLEIEKPAGQIVLEGPDAAGDLMLIRQVAPNGPIPRGRELLKRR